MKDLNPDSIWVEAARVDELPSSAGKTFRYGNVEIALFRLADGSVKAIENRCPHKNGVLAEGIVCGEVVHCPMHDRRIDLTSGQMLAPDIGCVRTYSVALDNETIYILLP